jgi:serine/threonine-protein kinase
MQRVGPHTVRRELERSGLLSTFDAAHDDGRPVRLRVFMAGVTPDPDAVQRFEDDARRAASCGAEGVSAPIAWSTSDPIHVSTPAPRATVSLGALRLASPSQRLAPAWTIGIALDVARALGAAHAAGLVHGGVSDAAILVDGDGRVVVTDFALAKLITSMSGTYSALLQGSIDHLAPEQLEGRMSPATDVFALGVMLYRTLTAKDPFPASSAIGISIRLSMGNADPIAGHGIALPAPLSALVMRMLSGSADARPSLRDVVSELSALVDRTGAWRDELRHAVRTITGELEASRVSVPVARASSPSASPATPAPPATPPAPLSAPASAAAYAEPPRASAPAPSAPSYAEPPRASAPAPSAPSYAEPPRASAPPSNSAPQPPPVYGPPAPAPSSFAGPPAPFAPAASAPPYPPASPSPAYAPPPSSFAGPPVAPAWSGAPPATPSAWAGAPLVAPPSAVESDDATDATFDPSAYLDAASDARPTIQDASAVPDEELPSFLRADEYEPTASWPTAEEAPLAVPKTVVMMDPRAASASAAAAPPPRPTPAPAPPPPPLELGPAPSEGSNLAWLIWVAVGLGALVVLGGSVALAMFLAG